MLRVWKRELRNIMKIYSQEEIKFKAKEVTNEFIRVTPDIESFIPSELFYSLTEYFFVSGMEFQLEGNVELISNLLGEQ